ncbi:hypothetical protein OUZ56_026668 [Daphnia magna]|uniref:Uncharacterized protein n=1 Tax=Daphnia magna TaxID=35525 RepID=A0ABQ9ZNS5_9CRUS|nr:hypothetical protein OUZ56_026668 [Daphnia magna]
MLILSSEIKNLSQGYNTAPGWHVCQTACGMGTRTLQQYHDVPGGVGKRERKELCQVSVLILTSAARFSSVSGPQIWRQV